jgi:hypothetical protein
MNAAYDILRAKQTVAHGVSEQLAENDAHSSITAGKRGLRVRLNGADHQWEKDPPMEVVG